jgi:hypothetical protein
LEVLVQKPRICLVLATVLTAACSEEDTSHLLGLGGDPQAAQSSDGGGSNTTPSPAPPNTNNPPPPNGPNGPNGPNAPSDGGPTNSSTCPGLICEDFESGSLPAGWTKVTAGTNTVTVQNAKVAHGNYAIQFHAKLGSEPNSTHALLFNDNLPASFASHYFGRMYFYATSYPFEAGGHSAFITTTPKGNDGFPFSDHHLEVGSYIDGQNQMFQLTDWGKPGGGESPSAGGTLEKGKWFCLEWEFAGAPNKISVWVDGSAQKGTSFSPPGSFGADFGNLGLGFRTWHPAGAPDIDVYMDDIVLDTKRVNCLP